MPLASDLPSQLLDCRECGVRLSVPEQCLNIPQRLTNSGQGAPGKLYRLLLCLFNPRLIRVNGVACNGLPILCAGGTERGNLLTLTRDLIDDMRRHVRTEVTALPQQVREVAAMNVDTFHLADDCFKLLEFDRDVRFGAAAVARRLERAGIASLFQCWELLNCAHGCPFHAASASSGESALACTSLTITALAKHSSQSAFSSQ